MISAAISQRRILVFHYNGIERTVNPHILGFDRGGHLSLSAWQTVGTSVGWRLFHVTSMKALLLSERHFRGSARGYNRDDPSFAQILARLEDQRRSEGTKSAPSRSGTTFK